MKDFETFKENAEEYISYASIKPPTIIIKNTYDLAIKILSKKHMKQSKLKDILINKHEIPEYVVNEVINMLHHDKHVTAECIYRIVDYELFYYEEE